MIKNHNSAGAGWLMFHSVGRFPGQTESINAELAAFTEVWTALDGRRWGYLDGKRREAAALWAALFGAPEDCVFATENVTAAFFAFISALDPARLAAKRVLVAADCFPSLHFMLSTLAPRLGFELVTVPVATGGTWVEDEDFLAAWDERVALAVITLVSSTSSHRADLPRLAAHGKDKGSLVAVDFTQAAGILPLDVGAPKVDFAAATVLKWLCGVPGAGFAYMAPELVAAAQPVLAGWFSQPNPFNWDLDKFALAEDARRFDHGTPSYLPYVASLPGLREGAAADRAARLAANQAICGDIISVLDAHRLTLCSPREADARGGSVMFVAPESCPAPDLVAHLETHGIFTDCRGDRVRASPGPAADADVVTRLDEALGTAVNRVTAALGTPA